VVTNDVNLECLRFSSSQDRRFLPIHEWLDELDELHPFLGNIKLATISKQDRQACRTFHGSNWVSNRDVWQDVTKHLEVNLHDKSSLVQYLQATTSN
jgi:hypothetical protein